MAPSLLRSTCTPAEHHEFVSAALADYSPRLLEARAWQAAKDEVVAAVAAARPGTKQTAKTLATVACRVLASQHRWDRASRPDLPAMLTADEVTRLCERWRAQGASLGLCRELRRLGKALTPARGAAGPLHSVRPFSLASQVLPDLAVRPVATTTALAGYIAAGGRVHALTFQGLNLPDLAPDLACLLSASGSDNQGAASTFAAARPAARALAAVRTAEVEEVSRISPSPSAKPTNTSKPPARRRRRRATATTQSPKAEPLSDNVAAAIAAYRPYLMPQPVWERIQDATRAALTAYRPRSAGMGLSNIARPVAAFAWWVADQPSRPDPAALLEVSELVADGLVDRYILSLADNTPNATRATYRSVLRRMVRNLGLTPQMPRLSHQAVQPPYSAAEVATMVRLAYNQPTVTRRRVLLTTLALGLGAGLDAGDQRGVTPDHIHDIADADGMTATVVTVTGRRPRTVVVADEHVRLLRDALTLHRSAGRKDSTPLLGSGTSHRATTDMMVTATGAAPALSVSRLRSTWLVAAMSAPVPLSVVLRVSGLASARTLTDLLPHCPNPDPEQVAAVLAGLRTDQVQVGGQS